MGVPVTWMYQLHGAELLWKPNAVSEQYIFTWDSSEAAEWIDTYTCNMITNLSSLFSNCTYMMGSVASGTW
jgi:hypothetical protein